MLWVSRSLTLGRSESNRFDRPPLLTLWARAVICLINIELVYFSTENPVYGYRSLVDNPTAHSLERARSYCDEVSSIASETSQDLEIEQLEVLAQTQSVDDLKTRRTVMDRAVAESGFGRSTSQDITCYFKRTQAFNPLPHSRNYFTSSLFYVPAPS